MSKEVTREFMDRLVRLLLYDPRCVTEEMVRRAAYWEPWARLLLTFELRTIPRCGHSPMIERPDAFNDLVVEFLHRAWDR